MTARRLSLAILELAVVLLSVGAGCQLIAGLGAKTLEDQDAGERMDVGVADVVHERANSEDAHVTKDAATGDACALCGMNQICSAGQCISPTWTTCALYDAGEDCDNVCATMNKTCSEACDNGVCNMAGAIIYGDAGCGSNPIYYDCEDSFNGGAAQCCCL
jgi:hypothetical protein